MNTKPKLLLIPDVRNWAFHTKAKEIERYCKSWMDIDVAFEHEKPQLTPYAYDIVHVFYPLDTYHEQFGTGNARLVTSVCSHRWEKNMTPMQLAKDHLSRFDAVAVISTRLLAQFHDLHPHVRLCPDGVNKAVFHRKGMRTGPLVVGWSGNASDPVKQLPLLQKACKGLCELRIADGSLDESAMVDFYNTIDVIVCCSQSEGGPRTLAEGMSCGNFPVSFPVGTAPELIEHMTNGLLVHDTTARGLREAMRWCVEHTDLIRSLWRVNVEFIRSQRDECHTVRQIASLYRSLLA